jgi:uncharacterized protein
MVKDKLIHNIVVKVAELCNLNCTYCYMYNHADKSYRDRPKVLSKDLFRLLVKRIKEHCDRHPPHSMSFTFHGGEPMLAGPDRIDAYAKYARDTLGSRLTSIGMQTNASLVNDRWIKVLHDNKIRVGVSLDGPAHIHNRERVDFRNRGSHGRALKGLLRLKDAGLFSGVLCVINPRTSGLETYEYFRSLGIQRISYLIPDVTHDSKSQFFPDVGLTPIADYLIPIFDK